MDKNYTCCFVGHRKINETEELRQKLFETVENLIIENKVDTFLLGSKSAFNSLCYEIVSRLKEKYPYIKRIFVRAEYPYISEDYKKYLLEFYEDSYYPEKVLGANKAVYVKRNYEMIDNSEFCIFCYDEENAPTNRKSGTKIALDYAKRKKCQITVLP